MYVNSMTTFETKLEDNEKFGVILILPQCAFSAELPRSTINEMLLDIDNELTERGAPVEAEARSEIMVDNALAISMLLANNQIDNASGIADIAYSFVYAFGKSIGLDQIVALRGLTGSFYKNTLRINPCLTDYDFQEESKVLTKKMSEQDDDEDWNFGIAAPTIH